MLRIGVDTGGTFTDIVLLENGKISVFKLPSTPDQPETAVLEGLGRFLEDREGYLVQHGSTVATNTLLERKGAVTLLVTNEGFEDVLEIGRQNRPELYNLSASRPQPLVQTAYRLGIKERSLWNGESLVTLEEKSLQWLQRKVGQLSPESIAVVLLYSYVNPEAEKEIAKALQSNDIPVSLSHNILPEFREYERTAATVVNAYLTPRMSKYLSALSGDPLIQKGKLTIMQSNGGSISAELAHSAPIRTLFSGPAGGVVGAFQLAREAGYEQIITFDMGGTSTDVCLCDNQITTTKEAFVDHYPIPLQMIGIKTVGSGGGSIAWIDSGDLIRVGPHSAGADPGPACYGTGEEPTVTDANLCLGRIEPDHFLGGEMKLCSDRSRVALNKLGAQLGNHTGTAWEHTELAEGIVKIVNTQMEGAIQVISLQRGYDTRDFTLVSFGGAGGLHACDLARSLLLPRVVVPPNPGLLSALGILRADVVKDTSLTVMLSSRDPGLPESLREHFQPLEDAVRRQLAEEGFSEQTSTVQKSLDVRYEGQAYELNIAYTSDFAEQFHRLHSQFYGYSNPNLPLDIVNVRVSGSGKHPEVPIAKFGLQSASTPEEARIHEKQVIFDGVAVPTSFYVRENLKPGHHIEGPAVILEYSSTTLLRPDFNAHVDEWLNIVMEPLGT